MYCEHKKLIEDLKLRAGYGHKPVTMSFEEFKQLIQQTEKPPAMIRCQQCDSEYDNDEGIY